MFWFQLSNMQIHIESKQGKLYERDFLFPQPRVTRKFRFFKAFDYRDGFISEGLNYHW